MIASVPLPDDVVGQARRTRRRPGDHGRDPGQRPVARRALLPRRRLRPRLGARLRRAGRRRRPARRGPRHHGRLPARPRASLSRPPSTTRWPPTARCWPAACPSSRRVRRRVRRRRPGRRDPRRAQGRRLAAALLGRGLLALGRPDRVRCQRDEKADLDPALTPEALRRRACDYLGRRDPATPLASPVFADLTGLPPLLIQVGSHEILLDDAVRLAARAAAHDVPSSCRSGRKCRTSSRASPRCSTRVPWHSTPLLPLRRRIGEPNSRRTRRARRSTGRTAAAVAGKEAAP